MRASPANKQTERQDPGHAIEDFPRPIGFSQKVIQPCGEHFCALRSKTEAVTATIFASRPPSISRIRPAVSRPPIPGRRRSIQMKCGRHTLNTSIARAAVLGHFVPGIRLFEAAAPEDPVFPLIFNNKNPVVRLPRFQANHRIDTGSFRTSLRMPQPFQRALLLETLSPGQARLPHQAPA